MEEKIIDFERKGNVVRFYLGAVNLLDWYGDDWNDYPYEHNAGTVYAEFISGFLDVDYPFDCLVLEPQDDWHNQGNSEWCKNDMKERKIPCIIVVPPELVDTYHEEFNYYLGMDGIKRIYFGDKPETAIFNLNI